MQISLVCDDARCRVVWPACWVRIVHADEVRSGLRVKIRSAYSHYCCSNYARTRQFLITCLAHAFVDVSSAGSTILRICRALETLVLTSEMLVEGSRKVCK